MDEIINLFLNKPYRLSMGKGSLKRDFSRILKKEITEHEIKEGKRIAREQIKNNSFKLNKGINKDKLPKILIFDLETAPLKGYIWSRWKQNIYYDQLISDWFLITWSAKWLYSAEVLSDKQTPEEILREDDKRITTSLWKLIDEADIIIAHNGDKFDAPKMNSRFLINGLPPTSSYRTIDTKKIAYSQFGFSSNSLNELARVLGIPGKLDTDFELWKSCLEGEQEALNYMQEYNDQDVLVLEEVYLKLRPYIKSHPNIAVYMDSDTQVCSSCGSTHLHLAKDNEGNQKYVYTNTAKHKLYRCECGALSRGRRTDFDKGYKKNLLTSVPR